MGLVTLGLVTLGMVMMGPAEPRQRAAGQNTAWFPRSTTASPATSFA
jgi:hypothetical protein